MPTSLISRDRPLRVALVTDAWLPQVNGVVRTWTEVRDQIESMGHRVAVIHPGQFPTIPCPKYPQIRLAAVPKLGSILETINPDAIHIAVEGPLGLAARYYCWRKKLPFTTSYHTKFPQYLEDYIKVPRKYTYRGMRWFHGGANATLVPTPSVKRELEAEGFKNIIVWTRGVDHDVFKPYGKDLYPEDPRPVFLYMGRVAREKNIEAFLDADLPGSKWVVGGGPELHHFESRYPGARFVGFKFGEELARHIAASDVFVFPSKTDTFGVVMLEALACGVPVAAFPVTGPLDVITDPKAGVLDEDIAVAAKKALKLNPEDCRAFARKFTWKRCAEMVVENLAIISQRPIDHLQDSRESIRNKASRLASATL